jgi:hypothetical protein
MTTCIHEQYCKWKTTSTTSLETRRLLNARHTASWERVLRWAAAPAAWENEDLELQRRDGGFECRDGKKLLIYGAHGEGEGTELVAAAHALPACTSSRLPACLLLTAVLLFIYLYLFKFSFMMQWKWWAFRTGQCSLFFLCGWNFNKFWLEEYDFFDILYKEFLMEKKKPQICKILMNNAKLLDFSW